MKTEAASCRLRIRPGECVACAACPAVCHTLALRMDALELVLQRVVEDTHQDDVLVQAGVLPQCGRDEDAILFVAEALEGAADEDPAPVRPGAPRSTTATRTASV